MPQLAKLTRPRTTGLIQRARLFEQLDRLTKSPVVWIAAPAGSGKTSLVASYLNARKRKGLWCQVDSGDNDLASFFYYLGLAVSHATPRKKPFNILLTPEYLPNLEFFIRRFFREMFQRLPANSVLVLDNFQDVASPQLADAISILCEEAPQGANVWVISRVAPPSTLTKQVANEKIAALPAEALRTNLAESRELLGSTAKVDAELLKQIQEKTNGWAAGVVLLREHLRRSGHDTASLFAQTPSSIFDYFAGQILGQLDEEARDFLLRTSLMPNMTAAMAAAISGKADAQEQLEYLYRNHVFTDRRDGTEHSYQYHPLFRDFLRARFRVSISSSELITFIPQCGHLLEQAGLGDDAAELYREAKAWPELVRLTVLNAENLIAQGRGRTLLDWSNSVPREILDGQPWLIFWQGLALMAIDPPLSRKTLELAHQKFVGIDDVIGRFAVTAGILETYRLDWLDMASVERWVVELDFLVRDFIHVLPPPLEVRVLATLSVLCLVAPEHELIEVLASRARDRMKEASGATSFLVGQGLLQLCTFRGDIRLAREIIPQVEEALRLGADPIYIVLWRSLIAVLASNIDFDSQTAFSSVYAGIQVAENTGVRVLDALLYAHVAYAALATYQPDLAREFVEKIKLSNKTSQATGMGMVEHLDSMVELQCGRFTVAKHLAETSIALSKKLGIDFGAAVSQLALGQARIALGEYDNIEELFQQVLEFGVKIKSPLLEHWALLGLAYNSLVQMKRSESLSRLKQGLEIARVNEYYTNFPWLPNVMGKLCSFSLDERIETDYVRRLIRKRALTPESIDTPNWPWPIKIYTLGRFAIELDDVPVTFARKTPKKDLALLKLITAASAKGLAEAKIKDELWPEMDGDHSGNALKQSLHRLRELLHDRDAIESKESVIAINRQKVWVDAWAFEAFCAKPIEINSNIDLLSKRTARLHELYQGNFLADDVDLAFLVNVRERLRGSFAEEISAMAQQLNQADAYADALELHRKAIEIDPQLEAFYQGAMRCHLKLERFADGLAMYERLRRVLLSQWKSEPSMTSKKLFEALHLGIPSA